MQFFLDTANIDEIKKYAKWGMIDGITTNPSLMAKEGVSLEKRIKEIAAVIDGPISSEVISTDLKGMIEEGKKMSKWHPNVYIKVPMTPNGLMACKALRSEGINVNVTLIFSASQAILAAKAGATFVSPFIGRLDDISEDGMSLIADIMQIFENYEFETKVLVASVRHPRHVVDSMLIGADICTMPETVFSKLIQHPLTDIGVERFLSDWKNAKKK